eukprot:CAMPEP_0181253888 /NCGR_PEP_ID=MMETSP1096-20121128/48289_1 /TAXON_ID=156174 ORGANISM="Chrysochromulina ericina, Strain CCMP281" /NCGR_SAMPLE_ID=MMETSP1096 /ASSEMBLY_ACC=CAM_ASM_000453 /LENGTH=148 /DNA_ID=CAMNT_0023351845 /DNA_START=256 /DNA_END=701 /DNA_ORIENTATION=-
MPQAMLRMTIWPHLQATSTQLGLRTLDRATQHRMALAPIALAPRIADAPLTRIPHSACTALGGAAHAAPALATDAAARRGAEAVAAAPICAEVGPARVALVPRVAHTAATRTVPVAEQSPQELNEQSARVQPDSQAHTPATHRPWPEQ